MSKNAFIDTSFGFNIEGSSPDVKRQQFDTIADMRACTNAPEGYITYCLVNGKRYEFHKDNDFLQESTGYWREYTATADLSNYATKAYVDSKLNKREVKQTTASYIANPPHKQDLDILYLVHVEGESYFNEYVATREKKTQTVPTIDGQPTPLDSSNILNFDSVSESEIIEKGQLGYILDMKNGVPGLYHDPTEPAEGDPVYPDDYEWTAGSIGDRYYDEDGTCWVATSGGWEQDYDPYNYSWLSLGTTEYDVSDKQDALTVDGSVIKANIGGTTYAISAEQVAAPAIAVITPNVASRDGFLSISMSCTTKGAVIRYTYTIDGSDPADPTAASSQYGSAIGFQADNTQYYITVKVKAASFKYGQRSTISSKTYTLYRLCETPAFSAVSGTQFDAERTVKMNMTGKSPNNAVLKYSKDNGTTWETYDRVNDTAITINSSPTTVLGKAIRPSDNPGDEWKESGSASTGAIIVGQRKMYYGSLKNEPFGWEDADVENMIADANVFNHEFSRSFSKSQAGVTGNDGYYMVVAYPKKTKTTVGEVTNKELVYADQGFMNSFSAWTHMETTNYHVYYAYNETSSVTFKFADHTQND